MDETKQVVCSIAHSDGIEHYFSSKEDFDLHYKYIHEQIDILDQVLETLELILITVSKDEGSSDQQVIATILPEV